MLVIGENINASNRSVAEAIASRDREFLQSLARAQAAAGADFINVNAGSLHCHSIDFSLCCSALFRQ